MVLFYRHSRSGSNLNWPKTRSRQKGYTSINRAKKIKQIGETTARFLFFSLRDSLPMLYNPGAISFFIQLVMSLKEEK